MSTSALLGGGSLYSGLFETAISPASRSWSGGRAMDAGVGTSDTLDERMRRMVLALDDCIVEAEQPNWDGAGARAVQSQGYARGLAFLQAIPSTVPPPELAVDPDGDLSFEWIAERNWRVVVALDERNILHYAAMFGGNLQHGKEDFAGVLPESVWRALQRVYRRPARQDHV